MKSKRSSPAILELLLRASAAVGLSVSALLLWEYTAPAAGLCGAGGGCDQVRHSAYAFPLGIPLPALGVAFFLFGLVMAHLPGRRWRFRQALYGTAGGTGALIFLAIQAFDLGVFCAFCVIVDVAALVYAACALILRASPADGRRPVLHATTALALLLPAAIGLGNRAPEAAHAHHGPVTLDPILAEQKEGVLTIVEFLDFQCPYCKKLHHELTPVLADYGDRVRVVRKHVPLPGHEHAVFAARAACCAEELGKGEEMADALFSSDDLTPKGCEALAEKIGLDLEAYRECFQDDRITERLKSDFADAAAVGVRGLPTFFIGTERFEGLLPADVLRETIERALANSGV